jgi:lactoylglutathione lyase
MLTKRELSCQCHARSRYAPALRAGPHRRLWGHGRHGSGIRRPLGIPQKSPGLWFRHGRIPRLDWSPMVKKLLHTRYRVSDLDKTVHFYKDVLGLAEVRRMTSGRGSQLVFFKAPGSEELIEICKYDASGPVQVGPDLTHLAFEVDDMEAFARHSASLGYPLSDGPHKSSSGIIAFIDAPEGYEVELIQPAKNS